jgi:hypothetical protein
MTQRLCTETCECEVAPAPTTIIIPC